MKVRLVCVLSFGIFILGTIMPMEGILMQKQVTAAQLQSPATGDLRILRSVTQVNRGGIGFITIQGQPGVRYDVRSTFRTADRTRNVNQWRVADASGQATFIWHVSPETIPGTYPVTIYGGGKKINISHIVLP